MTDVVLGNIPRLHTALADWLACILYISILRPRLKRSQTALVASAFLLLQGAFMVLTGNLPVGWFIPCIVASALIMLAFLYLCCDVTWKAAGYFTARAFILGELAASLEWQLYYYLYNAGLVAPWHMNALLALVYLVVFGGVYLLERRSREQTQALPVTQRELYIVLVISISAYLMSNLSYVYSNTPFSGSLPAEIFNIRTLMDFVGVALLYAYHLQVSAHHMKSERDAMQNILRSQYQQYQHFAGSIDLINHKYHDLKHIVNALRATGNAADSSALIDQIETDIHSYQVHVKTGNHVLDTVLTSKEMYCSQRNITLTCIVDGAAMDFMETVDLCTLFGNALDNAIEAVEKIHDSDKRIVHVLVVKKNNFVRIRVENYYEGDIRFEGELPLTTKADAQYHGYGIKSIRQTTQKYGGSVTLHVENHWFQLRVLIPC